MSYSIYAQFYIFLISRQWYNYNKYNIKQHKKLIFQIEENELEGPQLSFQHLANFRQTFNVIQPQGPKQKYGFAGLSNQQENVISIHISDLLRVRYKGRQPNRYKSCDEPQKKKVKHVQDITNIINKDYEEEVVTNQKGKKRERCCKNCNQVGHYASRCPNN
ncbi:hypothetical protein C1645_826905 [Glomus cerebriforme]|uniref:CCHC-type domain-containing protein n=1 Tax=Glomus cerebriforme TaxID=658196 RepID=A0A397SQT1_9GLOM|nr:hypothetical protein C1645_826905 [Glomus cerebriforme]